MVAKAFVPLADAVRTRQVDGEHGLRGPPKPTLSTHTRERQTRRPDPTGFGMRGDGPARSPRASGSDRDKPCDGELEPAILGGDRPAAHLGDSATRGGRVIEDAGRLDEPGLAP